MSNNKIEYYEISKAKVTDSRNIVISNCSKGGFTIAQQLEIKEKTGNTAFVFLKGAFHVEDIHGLYNLRDAINLAIKISENSDSQEATEEGWDE